jgi:hypothetical protein
MNRMQLGQPGIQNGLYRIKGNGSVTGFVPDNEGRDKG